MGVFGEMHPLLFDLPTKLHFGWGVLDELTLPYRHVCVILSSSVDRRTDVRTRVVSRLRSTGIVAEVFVKVDGEPESVNIDEVTDRVPDRCEAVVAIGGGSTLDVGKFAALIRASGGRCADYDSGRRRVRGALPTVLVPTTAGSGSEVTPYAVATNSATRRKFTVTHRALFPAQAIVDPLLTVGLPVRATIASGLDAFIHCLEARLNRQAHPLIWPLATQGMRLVHRHLGTALASPDDAEARTDLSLAAVFGGICIAHSRTGLIHTLSVAFAEFVAEPHGLLNARMLPYAVKSNLDHYDGDLAAVVREFSGVAVRSDSEARNLLLDWVQEYVTVAQPSPMDGRTLGSQADHVTERVLQDQGLAAVNARPVDRASIRALVEEIIADAA